MFLCLFYTKAGRFTTEEFDVALEENERRQLPLFISMRNLNKNQQEDESLTKFKNRLNGLEHFWHNYENNDKLHLDFVLWIDSYLFDGKSVLKASTDGTVTLGEVKVAQMSQLSFAANNDDYLRMYKELQDFPEKIKTLSDRVKRYPDDQEFRNELNQALDRNEALTDEFEEYQQILLDTAKHIADNRQEQAGEKLQRAIDAFDNGDLRGANAILREIAIDSEEQQHIEKYEKFKRRSDMAQELTNQAKIVVHQDINALQMQAKTEMTDLETPIDVRIIRVTEIYSKADDWAQRSDYDDASYNKLLFDYAAFLTSNSRFEDAEHVYLRLIEKLEKKHGSDYTDNAIAYHNLGYVYMKLGDTQNALEYYNKALTIRLDDFGEDHPDTATTYNNIGFTYYLKTKREKGYKGRKEDYEQALKYLNNAKTIREKVFGTDHVYTAGTYYSLSLVYNAVHEKRQYERYLEKVIVIRKRRDFLDKGDLEKASFYDTVGYYYKSKKNYDEALDYFKKALSIRKNNLGHDHTMIADSYERIGLICEERNLLDEALDAFHNSLSIREKTLRENHPKTALMYEKIGAIYRNNNYDEAIKYYIKALISYQNSSEVNSKKIAYLFSELGSLYKKIENYSQTIELFNKLLDIYQKTPEDNSGKIAQILYELGNIYRLQDDYSQAQSYYLKAIDVYEKSPKKNTRKIVQIQEKIGHIYRMQNDYSHALEYYLKALDNWKKCLRGWHSKIALLIKRIGKVYEEIGEIENAIKYYEESLDILERVSGDQNLKAAKIYKCLSVLYQELGDDIQANEYLSKYKLIRLNNRIVKSQNTIDFKAPKNGATIEELLESKEELKKTLSNGESSMELAQNCFEIAIIYYNLGDNGQAISNATESLSIYENYYSGEHPMISKICGLIGSAYKANDNYAKAVEYYQKSLNEFQDDLGGSRPASFSKLKDYASHFSRIGELYFLLGNYQTSLKYHNDALQLVDKNGVFNSFIATLHFYIGKDYECIEEYQEALNHYTMAFDYYNTKYGPNDPGTLRAKENIDRVEEKLRLGSSSE